MFNRTILCIQVYVLLLQQHQQNENCIGMNKVSCHLKCFRLFKEEEDEEEKKRERKTIKTKGRPIIAIVKASSSFCTKTLELEMGLSTMYILV